MNTRRRPSTRPVNPAATSEVEVRKDPESLALDLCLRHGEKALDLVHAALRKQETPDRVVHMLQTGQFVRLLLS